MTLEQPELTSAGDEHQSSPVPAWVAAGAVLGALPDIVVLADAQGVIRWVGPNMAASIGWTTGAVIGRPMYELFAKVANHDLHLQALASTLARPGVHGPLEVSVVAPDGQLRELEVMVTNAIDNPDIAMLVALGRDITDRSVNAEQARRSEAWASVLLRGSSDLILVCDRTGTIAYVSPAAVHILGRDPVSVVGSALPDLVHPEDLVAEPGAGHHLDKVIGLGPARRRVMRLSAADGSWRRLSVERTSAEELGDHTFLVTGREVTIEHDAANLLSEQTVLLEQIARGAPVTDSLRSIIHLAGRRIDDGDMVVGFLDRHGAFVCVAPGVDHELLAVLERTGISRPRPVAPAGSAPGADYRRNDGWDSVIRAATGGRYTTAWTSDLSGADGTASRTLLLRHSDGALGHEEVDLLGLANDLATIAIERHHLQARLAHGALHDELTGLPNRRFLMNRLTETFAVEGVQAGVLYVDLDRFKLINDSLGHEAGDELLREVTRRFGRALRPADLVARVGGDEFVVLCPDVDSPDALAHLAERLSRALIEPVDLPGARVVVSASVGVRFATGPTDPSAVLQDADLAMYDAKQNGRNRVATFHHGLRDRAVARLEVENALRDALRSDEMVLHYQPVIRLADQQMVGVEALLRWQRPGVGMVQPGDFIPVATDTGLILPLGRWVIDQACAAAARWPGLEVAANLSAKQLADVDLVDFVAETIEHHGIRHERLCLEVTESDLVTDPDAIVEQLRRLKGLGVRLAIDDFGTGFATLDYLRQFSAADVLKVDASFVAGITDPSSSDLAIVSAALVLAANLGFSAIAEGVETEAQRDVLERLGCELAQGHLFSRSVPADEIDALLHDPTTIGGRSR